MSFLCCLLSQPASLGRNEITLIKFIEDKFAAKTNRFHAVMIWIYRLRRLLAITTGLVLFLVLPVQHFWIMMPKYVVHTLRHSSKITPK